MKTLKILLLFVFAILLTSNVLAALTDGMLEYWKMEETGSVIGSLGIENSTSNTGTNVTGILSNGKAYSSTTTVFSTNNKFMFVDGQNITISAWVKMSSAGDADIVKRGAGQNNYDFAVFRGNYTFAYYPGTDQVYVTYRPPTLNTWEHVVITYTYASGSSVKVYVNGVLQSGSWNYGSGSTSVGTRTTDTLNFGVGGYLGTYGGSLDEVAIWNRTLDTTEIALLYNSGVGLTYPFGYYFNITNVTCTSCSPVSSTPPFTTDDTTPTFTFTNTPTYTACRISDQNLNYSAMNSSRDCDSGQNLTSHTCTLTTQDGLLAYNVSVYIACLGTSGYNTSVQIPMLITSLEAPNGSEAIQQGIENSLIWPGATVYTNQKVYLRSLNNTRLVTTVDKVAVYGNQRWLLNYANDTETPLGLFNIAPVVYVLDMQNMSLKDIRANVTALINATKI